MSDELDANDVVRAGRKLRLVGKPIDPGTVPDRERARAERDDRDRGPVDPEGGGGDWQPPSDDELPRGGGGGRGGDDDRVRIVVTTREDEVNAQAVDALAGDEGIYVRGNALVRVIPAGAGDPGAWKMRDPDSPLIDVVPREIVQERLSARARFVRIARGKPTIEEPEGPEKEVPMHPPKWCVGAVAQRGIWPGFRHLEAIVEQPVLRMDGSVLERPGFDRKSGILFLGDRGFTVPRKPSAADVKTALAEILDVVCDFCFAQDAHRSGWLAAALTPLARYAFRGPSPLFLFDASTPSAGKGLATECAIRIGTGRGAPLSSYTPDDAEMDKRITTWASSGSSVVVLDNVSGRLGGDSLCRVLTGTTYEGRVLGMSKKWVGPALMVWYATGNNVALGDDMYRRICHVRILSTVEDPSKRTGFKYPHLVDHVSGKQRELARAGLTILRAYCEAGRPDQHLEAWGSYEGWSALVRSAIVWAGLPDPSQTRDELRKSADTKSSVMRALVKAWHALLLRLGRDSATAKQAIEYACKSDPGPLPELRSIIDEVASKDGKPSSKGLGYVLRSLKDKPWATEVGLLALQERGEDRNGTKLWGVTVLAAAGDAGDAGDPSEPRARDQTDDRILLKGSDHPHSPHHPQTDQSSLPLDDPGDGEPWYPPDDEDAP
jgi:hypothetical protein